MKIKHDIFLHRSKPRLSVHERQKQRLAAAASITPVKPLNINEIESNENHSKISS